MEAGAQKTVKLRIAPGKWTPWAAEKLQEALPYAPVAGIESQVRTGAAVLFYVWQGKARVACYVLRVDGTEGVIVAAAGACKVREGEVSLTQTMLAHIEKQFTGVSAMRIHTARPGLIMALIKQGYAPQEFVMRKPCQ